MIDKIVIHCSASPNGRADTAADIHQWHKEKGWDGIGYHYVIEADKVSVGRPEYWQGAHAYGHNDNSLGICLIGTDVFSAKQWHMLENLVRELSIRYPDVQIMGHNEVSSKACPGFDVQEWLLSIALK